MPHIGDLKQHYAWEFLRRNPDYCEFWKLHQEALVGAESKSRDIRRKNREILVKRKAILRDDARRALEQWGLTKIADPNFELGTTKLNFLFKHIKPVAPFFDAPWAGDTRLYLAIDPYSSIKAIDQAVHRELKLHKSRLNIPQRDQKKPRQKDLKLYLDILDCYRDCLLGPHAENRSLPNYGYTKGWAKLAKRLEEMGYFESNANQLLDGTFVQALTLRDNSPFCFLA